ncbi:MAG: hypothetical protein RLZZ232_2722, partial [Planctomycetota bacterium]
AGEFGVKVTGAGVAMLVEKDGSNAAKYAISTTGGTVGLVGLPGVDLTGPLALNINKLGRTVDVSLPAPSGVSFPLKFTAPDAVQRFAGDVNLTVAGFTTLTGTYVFEKDTDNGTTEIRVAGTNINALLGSNPDGVIGTSDDVGAKITNARLGAVLYRTSAGATSYALDAKGTASLVGVDGFTLTGDLSARVNTTGGAVSETITMPSGDPVNVTFGATEAAAVFSGTVTAEVSSFATVSGSFAVSKNGDLLTVAAAGVTAFVGSGDLGVRVTNAKLGVVVKTDTKKFAAVASGNAALEGVSGLTVTGTGSVRINKLGETVDQTITTPAGDVDVEFTSAADVLQIHGSLALQFESFVQASGDFLIEKQETAGLTTITASATNLDAFLGINYGQAGEFGVRIDDAGMALIVEKATGVDAKFAVSSLGGTVSISGLPDLDLDGPLNISINKLGHAVDVDVPTLSGTTIPIEFPTPDPVQRLAGDLSLSISGFTTLTGSYVFELDTTDSSTTRVRVAGTSVSAFLGNNPDGVTGTADDVGATITNGRFGAVFFKRDSGTSYAIDASGTAALVGVPGLTLSGSLAAQINTTGGAVNETIAMPSGSPVQVVFGANESAPVFSGIVSANANGFASLSGAFSISKSNSQLTVAAAGVTAFVGSGDTGLRLSNGNLGVVVDTTSRKYALVAGGTVSLEGIDAFEVSGSAAVRINKLGAPIDQTITTPGGDVAITFPTDAEVLQVNGTVALSISDFVNASATIAVEKTTSGDLSELIIQATAVTAFLGAGGSTTDTADDMGVRLKDGAMDLRIQKSISTDVSSYVFAARGTVELAGISSISASGTVVAQRSTADVSTVLDFGTADVSDDVTVAADSTQFGGNLSLAIAGFTTLSGNFGFEKVTLGSTTKIKVAATNVNAFLGSNPDNLAATGDEVGAAISGARLGAVLYRTAAGNSYAIDAAGTAALVGVSGLTLSGTLAARINTTGGAVNETIAVPGGAPVQVDFGATETGSVFSGTVTADAGGFASLSGAFSIAKSGSQLTVAAAGVTAFVGAGDTGLRLTGGNLGVVVNTDSKKFALVAGGNLALEGIDGFTVGGSAAVRINKLGTAVDETISTPGGDVSVSFPTSAEILQVSGTVSLTISDYIDATVSIAVEKETVGDLTNLNVIASNATAFLGVGASTPSTSDDMGVQLTNGALDLRWTKDSATDTSWYALGARGTASLVGISGLTLTGSLQAERNTGPGSVTLDFGTPSTSDDLTLESGAKRFGGSAQLSISGFVDISGSFGFEETTETVGGIERTRIKVAAAGIQTFLGANGTGVQLSNGQIGAIIDKPVSGDAKYAVVASGTATLVGISGLTLTGTMNARVNRLGTAIDTVISTPAGPVQVKFDDGSDVTQFGGSAKLAIGGFVDLSGSFGIEKSGSTLLVGVAGVEAFLGMGAGTDSAIGLKVSNGNLGLVLKDGSYALTTSGTVGLVGLTGLNISGTFNVRSNQL